MAKICQMFSSSYGGERSSAAEIAAKMVNDSGLTWFDVLNPVPQKQNFNRHEYKTYSKTDLSDQIMKADFINQNDVDVTAWEAEFWNDIQDRIYSQELTEKQMSIVNRIYGKVKKK